MSTKLRLEILMKSKEELEAKIKENGEILEVNGNVGMNGPLVDGEGFPRNDIDIYRVRQARQQIICFQNDYKDLMNELHKLLNKYHEELRAKPDFAADPVSDANRVNDDNVATKLKATTGLSAPVTVRPQVELRTIVIVDLITSGSPAETAGLCVNDEILEFGTINSTNFSKNLYEIGELVRKMQNKRLNLKVKRNKEILDIILIPKTWSGRGLLGCNIVLPKTS